MLYDTLKAAQCVTDSVLVAFSGGKDSAVTLDLCCKYFSNVEAFFMYQIPNLSFQEAAIRTAEKRYNIKIHRIPHFEISEFLRYGVFREPDFEVPIVKIVEIYNYLREQTGIYWIAAGERISDSIVRRAMIKHDGTMDLKRGRIYPVAEWRKKHIVEYVKAHKLLLSPESAVLGHSFRSLYGADLLTIRNHYPDDYSRIRAFYPYVDVEIKRLEMQLNGTFEISKI